MLSGEAISVCGISYIRFASAECRTTSDFGLEIPTTSCSGHKWELSGEFLGGVLVWRRWIDRLVVGSAKVASLLCEPLSLNAPSVGAAISVGCAQRLVLLTD